MEQASSNRRVAVISAPEGRVEVWKLGSRGVRFRKVLICLRAGERGRTVSSSHPSAGVPKVWVRLDRGYEVLVPTAGIEYTRPTASDHI
jgi:hypothetical protein